MQVWQARKPIELALTTQKTYDDIFNQVDVDVVFASTDGESWRVPAFWAGGGTFRVRFAAPSEGRYSWRSYCTDDDTGLHGQAGQIETTPYGGSCELYQRGRLRIAGSRRTLEHADGTPFLWLADTWWMGLTKRLDWPEGFAHLAADRVAKGFNVIQVVAGPLPDFDAYSGAWNPQQGNEAGLPWEQGWTRINPAFYDLADLRIAHLVEMGLMPCIVSMWGYYLPAMGVDKVKKHWRYLVARYGAYPIVWCLAGECTMPTYSRHANTATADQDRQSQKAGWTEVAQYLRQIDPYHNLLTVHPAWDVPGRQSLADASLLDFDMLQTGHSGYLSLKSSVERMNVAVAAEPVMPVLNSEVNYEGIMGGSWQDVQRYLFWSMMLSGACGHTYGAQGIWAMSSRHEPFQGTTGSWGDAFWQDAMHYSGSAHVGIGRKLLMRYPWWLLRPRQEEQPRAMGRVSSLAAEIPGALAIFYLPSACLPPELMGASTGWRNVLPLAFQGVDWRARYLNPRTAAEMDIGAVVPTADGKWAPPPMPTMEDWVLAVENPTALKNLQTGRGQ